MAAAALLGFGCGTEAAAPPDASTLHAEMTRIARDEGLTGVVWAARTPDASILGAAGTKHAVTPAPMQPDTKVHVGSVAKVVVAVGVLRLVTQGRLALDARLADVLPNLAIDNEWAAAHPVRVDHLLAHTAGLENARLWQVFSLRPRPDSPLREGLELPLRVATPPGSRFSYSNAGYTVLGMVIEAVTGQRYESYLDAHVLGPLGMASSTFEFTTQSGNGAEPRLAMGHFDGGVPQAAVPSFLRPAGQFTTTAADMARLAAFLMGDGRLDAKAFIDAALLARLARPEGTEAAIAGLDLGHGLALAGRDRHGVRGDCHAGTTVGFRAMFCIFPGQGKAYFFAANIDSETADYERLNAALIAALRPEVPPRPASGVASGLPECEGFYVPRANGIAPFAYADTLFHAVRVSAAGANLHVRSQSAQRVLEPAGGGRFRATDRNVASHVLFVSSRGARVLDTGVQSYERMSPIIFAALWASLAAGLAGLAYLLVAGAARLARRRLARGDALLPPFAGILALAAPIPFFFLQPFLALGDLTLASGLLAAVTALLPVAMAAGLVRYFRRREPASPSQALEAIAMGATLQWTLVLAAWGLLPLRLWA